jgi:hypothetical protein
MVYFHTKNPKTGKCLSAKKCKILEHVTSIWNNLQQFGKFYGQLEYFVGIWLYFTRYRILNLEKCGNPDLPLCHTLDYWLGSRPPDLNICMV